MESFEEGSHLVELVQVLKNPQGQDETQPLSEMAEDNSEDDGFDEEDSDYFGEDYDDMDLQFSSNLASSKAAAGNKVMLMSEESLPACKKVKVCGEDEFSGNDYYIYHVLSTMEIAQCMATSITEVNAVLQLPSTIVRLLLNHFGWNEEKLLEIYYETGDTQKLFKDAMIFYEDASTVTPDDSHEISDAGQEEEDCEICCLSKSPLDLFGMKCGHRFCTDCWVAYFSGRILEGGGGSLQVISCAGHNCPILMDDDTVMNLLTKDAKLRVKYQQLITNKFVQCNRLMKWCPEPGCTFAIKVLWLDGREREVTCSGCQTKFCFECQTLNGHVPVKCEMIKQWLKKCEDDSETSNWLMTNTRDCPNPKCKLPIEKDGGCNFMVCATCKSQFCWVCMSLWSKHRGQGQGQGYGCNRYEGDKDTGKGESLEKTREVLKRYLFYFKHFNNQRNSLKLEGSLEEKMGKKMEELMEKLNMSWVDARILKQAVEVLSECRHTLMNTYVFAYYVETSNDKEILEDNQEDLANATEKLSGYLERDIDEVKLTEIKQRVLDMSKYCAARRKVLIDHVEEGRENDSWVYIKQ